MWRTYRLKMEASYNVEKKLYQTNHQDIMHFNFQKQEL